MYLDESTHQGLLEALERVPVRDDEMLVLFVAEEEHPDLDRLVAGLCERRIEFLGGMFPGVIHGDRLHRKGTIAKVLPRRGRPFVIPRLDVDRLEFPDLDPMTFDLHRPSTAIVLVDGMTSNISGFLAELYHRFGNAVNYIGGGAGTLDLRRTPCVITPLGVLKDAAIVGIADVGSRLGVRHGWRKLTGPFVATRTRGNVLVELNWRGAFDVYSEAIARHLGRAVTRDEFDEVRRRYPFGIHRRGCEDVVRDPLSVTDGGELVCCGDVPENAVLHVLEGEKDALVHAAGLAVQDCRQDGYDSSRQALIIDCISRVTVLEDRFEQELRAVRDGMACEGEGAPQGAATLGEISSSGGFLEFFNMTIVTGVLHD